MNIDALSWDIVDQIMEAQIKLGYARESVRLYYPVQSINTILQTDIEDIDDMVSILNETFRQHEFLKAVVGSHQNRIEIKVSEDSVEYIHNNVEQSPFLVELINKFGMNHHMTIEEVEDIFAKFSNQYVVEKMPEGADFDYAIYFTDKELDKYYYCIKMEMGHTIYHRFSPVDYAALIKAE